jgi:UDP-glucose 4-epimerase
MTKGEGVWLVTGGAGYIGSHVVRSLSDAGFGVVVLDDLSTGLVERLPESIPLVVADCSSSDQVHDALISHKVVGIVHLAAFKHARESAQEPLMYWRNNVGAMLGVLGAVRGTAVQWFVFSSSCSVYGASGPVGPGTPTQPLSPYGRTKLTCEEILGDVAPELGLSFISLRYFNVIGNGEFHGAHDTSTECLVPVAYERAVRGLPVRVFGTDFATPDGTALRDYLDVRDLARAHAKAAECLATEAIATSLTLDVGRGTPTSVREILDAVSQVINASIIIEDVGSHVADPPAVWAPALEICNKLDWGPQHDQLSAILAHHRSTLRTRNGVDPSPATHVPIASAEDPSCHSGLNG